MLSPVTLPILPGGIWLPLRWAPECGARAVPVMWVVLVIVVLIWRGAIIIPSAGRRRAVLIGIFTGRVVARRRAIPFPLARWRPIPLVPLPLVRPWRAIKAAPVIVAVIGWRSVVPLPVVPLPLIVPPAVWPILGRACVAALICVPRPAAWVIFVWVSPAALMPRPACPFITQHWELLLAGHLKLLLTLLRQAGASPSSGRLRRDGTLQRVAV